MAKTDLLVCLAAWTVAAGSFVSPSTAISATAKLPSKSEVLAVMNLVAHDAQHRYPANAEAYWDDGSRAKLDRRVWHISHRRHRRYPRRNSGSDLHEFGRGHFRGLTLPWIRNSWPCPPLPCWGSSTTTAVISIACANCSTTTKRRWGYMTRRRISIIEIRAISIPPDKRQTARGCSGRGGMVGRCTSGNKVFRFTVTGKNSAGSGYATAIDYVMLTRQ